MLACIHKRIVRRAGSFINKEVPDLLLFIWMYIHMRTGWRAGSRINAVLFNLVHQLKVTLEIFVVHERLLANPALVQPLSMDFFPVLIPVTLAAEEVMAVHTLIALV
jgi:hypothetical protein